MLYQRYMCVTLQRPLPSLYVFACKNGRVVAELWPSCAEYRASCVRVVRVLGELLGEIVKFGQLAQKRLAGHLCGPGYPREHPSHQKPANPPYRCLGLKCLFYKRLGLNCLYRNMLGPYCPKVKRSGPDCPYPIYQTHHQTPFSVAKF